MKLNLVATYEIGGKSISSFHQIDSGSNLVNLDKKLNATFPKIGGELVHVSPCILTAFSTAKEAKKIMHNWNESFERNGVLWRGEAVL